MERRALLSHIAVGAAGLVASQSLLAKAETTKTSSPLLDAAVSCHQAALSCQSHCIKALAVKDLSMLNCFNTLTDLLALNQAGLTLFANDSTSAKDFSAVLKKSADACAIECGKHAKHHEVCAACEKACLALSKSITARYA